MTNSADPGQLAFEETKGICCDSSSLVPSHFIILVYFRRFCCYFMSVNFTILWVNSADGKLVIFSSFFFIFFYFLVYFFYFQETEFDYSCKLSPMETLCMKFQILFTWKNKKNVSICRLLKILSRVLSVNALSGAMYPAKAIYPA